jgi:hypothetical protein
VRVGAKVVPNLAPFSFWSQVRWGNLLCDDWCRCYGTYCMEVSLCMGLGCSPGHGSMLRLFGCIGGIFDRKSLSFFPVKALQSFSPSSLVAHNHQNRCCVQALGSCITYHYNEVLELRLVLQLSSIARVCRNAGPPTSLNFVNCL